MTVKKLIEELKKHDENLEVRIHPDLELFIDKDTTCYGDVGKIEEKDLIFDGSTDLYSEKSDFIENRLDSGYSLTEIENGFKAAEKLHAVFIKAVV